MPTVVPSTSIQVSFTDPFDTPDWVDITKYVRSGTTKRGRQHELQRAVAGTCALTITNQDGRFSTFNTNSPYLNLMTGADSYFSDVTIGDTTPGSWGNTTNSALNTIASEGYDGYPAMSMTSSASGNMTASTAIGTSGYAVTAGKTYGFQVQFLTAVTGRTCSAGVAWYNSSGTQIGSTTFGTGVSDTTSAYTKALLTATAPTGAVTCAVVPSVASTGAANEVHYVARVMISHADAQGIVSTAWAPGARGLVPARPVRVLSTWPVSGGTQYPVYYGYVDSWIPSYGAVRSDQVINCSDGMALLALPYITTSAYRAQVLADGAAGYWRLGDASGSSTIADAVGNNNPISNPNQVGGLVVALGGPGLLVGDTDTSGSLNCLSTPPGFLANLPKASLGYTSASGFTIEGLVSATGSLSGSYLFTVANSAFFSSVGSANGPYIGSDGLLHAAVNSNDIGVSSAATVTDGKAHHVALTWSSTGTAVLYLDGSAVGTVSGLSTPGATAWYPFLNQYQEGFSTPAPTVDIDEFSVTPSVLSASQIAVHAALAKTGFIQQQSGQRIAAVLTALGIPSSLQSLATGISAVQAPQSPLTTTQALSHIQTVENTEQGFFYVDESGNFTYHDRHYILQNAAATTSNGTFASDANPAHFRYDVGSLIPADDALDLWNDWPVSAIANAALGVTGDIQDAPNTDSEKWYGRRTQTGYTSMLQVTDTEAASLSEWGVAHYGLPKPRVRQMKLSAVTDAGANLPQMLGRKLWDCITVQWQPIDGTNSPFSQDSLIESIQHDFTPFEWTTTWGLSVAETQEYLTLNDPVRGTLAATGALTGNRLGF